MSPKSEKRTPPDWAIFTLALLALVTLNNGCDRESGRQLSVLKQFSTETPLYRDFRQVRSSESHKLGTAMLIGCYSSAASLKDVTDFYSPIMSEKGWSVYPSQERTRMILYDYDLVFRKGDYFMGVKYDEAPYQNCDYLLVYYWKTD